MEDHAERRRRLQLEERNRAQKEREEREREQEDRKRREVRLQEEKNREMQSMERNRRQREQQEAGKQREMEEKKRKEQFEQIQQIQEEERKKRLQQGTFNLLSGTGIRNVKENETKQHEIHSAPATGMPDRMMGAPSPHVRVNRTSAVDIGQQQQQQRANMQATQYIPARQQQHQRVGPATNNDGVRMNFANAMNNAKQNQQNQQQQQQQHTMTPTTTKSRRFSELHGHGPPPVESNPGYDWASSASSTLQTSPTVQAHINEARQRRTQWEIKDPHPLPKKSNEIVQKVKEDSFQRQVRKPFATEQSLKVKLELSSGLQNKLMQFGLERTRLEADIIRLEPQSRRKMDARLQKERIEIRLGVIRKDSMSIKKQLREMGM